MKENKVDINGKVEDKPKFWKECRFSLSQGVE